MAAHHSTAPPPGAPDGNANDDLRGAANQACEIAASSTQQTGISCKKPSRHCSGATMCVRGVAAALVVGLAAGMARPAASTAKKGLRSRENMHDARFDERAEAVRDSTIWYRLRGGVRNGVIAKNTEIGWGLVAERDVAAGETVLTTPREFCVTGAEAPEYLAATRGVEGAALVSASAAVAATLLEREGDGFWEPYLGGLPTAKDLADLPALWPDGEAEALLAGTQTGRSRAELLATWQDDLAAINARRALFDPAMPPIGWPQWRYYETLVMTRGYNLDPVGYVVLPYIDFVNHADDPSVALRVDAAAAPPQGAVDSVSLVAKRDIPKGEQIFSSYSGGDPIDALVSLQAFGWLALGDGDAPLVQSCRVDFAQALRRDDPLADVKFSLLDVADGGGRALLTNVGDADVDARMNARALHHALVACRLVAMDDDELLAQVDNDAPEASAWATGAVVSDDNEAAARQAGSALVRRLIAATDHEFETRTNAGLLASETDEGARRATLARATAESERAALCTLLDLLEGRA